MGPHSRSSSRATGCSGIRSTTVPRVRPRSHASDGACGSTIDSPPGQNASTRSRAALGTTDDQPVDRRPAAHQHRARASPARGPWRRAATRTAAWSNASAPMPYEVSVGTTTSLPARTAADGGGEPGGPGVGDAAVEGGHGAETRPGAAGGRSRARCRTAPSDRQLHSNVPLPARGPPCPGRMRAVRRQATAWAVAATGVSPDAGYRAATRGRPARSARVSTSANPASASTSRTADAWDSSCSTASASAVAQQPGRGGRQRPDDREPVGPGEHRVVRVVVHLRADRGPLGHVRRVRDHHVDDPLERRQGVPVGDVGGGDQDPGAVEVAAGPGERALVELHRVHLGVRPRRGEGERECAGAGAQVHRTRLADPAHGRDTLGEQQLGLGTGHEDPRADRDRHRTQDRAPDEVLQRLTGRAAGHQGVQARLGVVVELRGQDEPGARHPEHVRGEQFGVHAGALDARLLQAGGGVGDACAGRRDHRPLPSCPASWAPSARRSSRSAARSASSTLLRSPSSTRSRS